jgi:hypothetical protein
MQTVAVDAALQVPSCMTRRKSCQLKHITGSDKAADQPFLGHWYHLTGNDRRLLSSTSALGVGIRPQGGHSLAARSLITAPDLIVSHYIPLDHCCVPRNVVA